MVSGMHHLAKERGAAEIKDRVGRQIDVIEPTLGARPGGVVADVGHGPGHLNGIAGEGWSVVAHPRHREVGFQAHHAAVSGLGVVGRPRPFKDHFRSRSEQNIDDFTPGQLFEGLLGGRGIGAFDDLTYFVEQQFLVGHQHFRIDVGFHEDTRTLGSRWQGKGGFLRVLLARIEFAVMRHAEDQPLRALAVMQLGVARHVNRIGPLFAVGGVLTIIGDGPTDGDLFATLRRGRRCDLHDLEIGGRRVENSQGPGLEIAALKIIRRIGIQIDVKRLLINAVVGIGPDGDEELAGDVLGQRDGDIVRVGFVDVEHALVPEGAQEHITALRIGTVFRTSQPDGVVPASRVGDARATVHDLVMHGDGGGIERFGGSADLCHHQIRRRHRCHIHRQRPGDDVVGLLGIFIDGIGAIGRDEEVEIAAITERNLEIAARGVRLAGGQRAAIRQIAQQPVAAIPLVIER